MKYKANQTRTKTILLLFGSLFLCSILPTSCTCDNLLHSPKNVKDCNPNWNHPTFQALQQKPHIFGCFQTAWLGNQQQISTQIVRLTPEGTLLASNQNLPITVTVPRQANNKTVRFRIFLFHGELSFASSTKALEARETFCDGPMNEPDYNCTQRTGCSATFEFRPDAKNIQTAPITNLSSISEQNCLLTYAPSNPNEPLPPQEWAKPQ